MPSENYVIGYPSKFYAKGLHRGELTSTVSKPEAEYVEKHFAAYPADPKIWHWQWRFCGYGVYEREYVDAWLEHERIWKKHSEIKTCL